MLMAQVYSYLYTVGENKKFFPPPFTPYSCLYLRIIMSIHKAGEVTRLGPAGVKISVIFWDNVYIMEQETIIFTTAICFQEPHISHHPSVKPITWLLGTTKYQ